MNILHIISSRGWGGAENSAAYLAKTQIEHGNNVYFFIHSLNFKFIKILKSLGIPYFSAFDPERKNIFAIRKIIGACRKHGINLIHTHLATGCYLGVLAGKNLGIPVVSRINTYCGYPWYAMADRLLFVSNDIKNYFLEDYFKSEAFMDYSPPLIENIINKSYSLKFEASPSQNIASRSGVAYDTLPDTFGGYDKKEAEKDKIYDNFFNIGITGRITKEKGQQYIIEAVELLLKESPFLAGKPVMLHIVGSGKNEKNLKKMASEKNMGGSVKFWGYKSDVRPLVNMFDIAVSYTAKEPFGINNIEYMLMKKPCIAANAGGTPVIFGDTNMLVEPENPVALKEAFKKYAADPELMAREAERGCERAKTVFNSEKVYNDTMREYGLT